jgi:hypothetical protein
MELVQVEKDYPSGIYLIKGEEVDREDEFGIFLQTGGMACLQHVVKGDFYQVADWEEEQKHWIFNDDFWYLMHKYEDGTFLSPPMSVLKKINWAKDGHDAFDTFDKWTHKKYNISRPKYNGEKLVYMLDEYDKYRDALQKAAVKEIKPLSDIPKMIQDTIFELSGLKIKILDDTIEEAFVHVEILEGDIAGPAILTWDNCD